MINLLLDILIYNNTNWLSYFFLLNINKKNYLYNLIITLFIDIFIIRSFFICSIYMSIIYYIKNKYIFTHTFVAYYIFNIVLILLFCLILGSIKYISNIILVNSIYIVISYILGI